jgi:hypothetical protein
MVSPAGQLSVASERSLTVVQEFGTAGAAGGNAKVPFIVGDVTTDVAPIVPQLMPLGQLGPSRSNSAVPSPSRSTAPSD